MAAQVNKADIGHIYRHSALRRRVDQIWKRYRDTDELPIIGQNMGQPQKQITDEESEIIENAHQQFKFTGNRILEKITTRSYPGIRFSNFWWVR